MDSDVNAIVIGGGAAGLSAAVELERLGLSCQLLEAQMRLGGRVDSRQVSGDVPFDRGAQMVNGDMHTVLGIARDAGLHCSPVPAAGRDLCYVGGDQRPRDALLSEEELEALLDAHLLNWSGPRQVLRSLKKLHHWWTSPWEDWGEARRGVARALSRRASPKGSLAEVIDRLLLDPRDSAIVTSMICEQYGAAPEVLDADAICDGLARYGSDRGDLEFQFPAGMGRIIDRLATRLRHRPMLGTPVWEIRIDRTGAEVVTEDRVWRSDYVILAVPPPVARRITLDVPDSHGLADLLAAFEPGDLIKTVLSYERAFWRHDGLSGAVSFADPAGLELRDTSFDTGAAPRLTAYLGGPVARQRAGWSPADRARHLCTDLSVVLGPDAAQPTLVQEAVWVDDPWSGGGYNATVRLGHASDAATQLAAWPGRLRFAGAELDDGFAGYVEGAVRSGRNAASAIAERAARPDGQGLGGRLDGRLTIPNPA